MTFCVSTKWTPKRIIAIILLVLSFAMIFLPWVTLSINVMGQKFTIAKLFDYSSMLGGESMEEAREDVIDWLYDTSEDMAWEGITMNPRKAIVIFDIIAEGKLSPIEAAKICSSTGKLFRELKSYFAKSIEDSYYLSSDEQVVISMISSLAGKVTLAAVFMWVLIGANLVCFGLAVYMLLNDKKNAAVPQLVASVVLLLVFVLAISKVNGAIKQLISTSSYIVSDLLSEFGLNYGSTNNVNLLHLGFAGILSIIFAASAFVLPFVETKSLPRVNINIPTVSKKWTCPNCGNKMNEANAFCANCGAKKPEARRCVNCGQVLKDDVAFCPNCGTPSRAHTDPSTEVRTSYETSYSTVRPPERRYDSNEESTAGSSRLMGTLAKPKDDDL